jgi:hypothetical protein
VSFSEVIVPAVIAAWSCTTVASVRATLAAWSDALRARERRRRRARKEAKRMKWRGEAKQGPGRRASLPAKDAKTGETKT